jgi:hypothetical protein
MSLIETISQEQFDRVSAQDPCDIDCEFLGSTDIYERLSESFRAIGRGPMVGMRRRNIRSAGLVNPPRARSPLRHLRLSLVYKLHAANSSSSAFASFRSRVSKPSANHP